MYECVCQKCGKHFYVDYKSKIRKFCSHQCANEFSTSLRRVERIKINCAICGKQFEVRRCDTRYKNGTVKYCSKACASEANKTGEIKKCLHCGKEFYTTRNDFCSQKCAREYKKANYKHKEYMENGYVCLYVNGYNKKGNVKKHRYLMEQKLGRKLLQNEVVHHINGNKTDNRIENLAVMERGEHSKLHRKEEKENGKHLFGGYHNN